jgi:hypothetical protein
LWRGAILFFRLKTTELLKNIANTAILSLCLVEAASAQFANAGDYAKNTDYFACAGVKSVEECRCYKSKLNCTVPSTQPHRNRFKPMRGKNPLEWQIKPNTELKDGFGVVRGVLRDKHVQINYGMRKMIKGTAHVYAFAEPIKGKGHGSGWIEESQLIDAPLNMPTLTHDVSGIKIDKTPYSIMQGMPKQYEGIKIRPKSYSPKNEAVADYFERPGGVINLIYSLPGNGGVSCDTFIINDDLRFYKAKNVEPINVPTFMPRSAKQIGELSFVFGKMADRYGWIPSEVLIKSAN